MDAIEKRAKELLASCLDEWGHHQEAENVREDEDLESYDFELCIIGQLLLFGFETGSGREASPLTPPEGYVLVPVGLSSSMAKAAWATLAADGSFEEIWTAMLAARPEVP